VAAPKANGWSSCRDNVKLSFAEGAQCIYLEPLINTILVEEVPTWEQPEFVIVHIPCQADTANLQPRESI